MAFRNDLEATRQRAKLAEEDREAAEAELEAVRARAAKAEARAAKLEKALARAKTPRKDDPRKAPAPTAPAPAPVAVDETEIQDVAGKLQWLVLIAAAGLVAVAIYFIAAK